MGEQLNGRELDEAVARVLGTYRELCEGGMDEFYDGWICDGCGVVTGRWGEDLELHAKVLRYSSDAATLPEMLRWLWQQRHRAEEPCLNITFSDEKSYVILADNERKGRAGVDYLYERVGMGFGMGDEWKVNEAICRLILAVAATPGGEAKQTEGA